MQIPCLTWLNKCLTTRKWLMFYKHLERGWSSANPVKDRICSRVYITCPTKESWSIIIMINNVCTCLYNLNLMHAKDFRSHVCSGLFREDLLRCTPKSKSSQAVTALTPRDRCGGWVPTQKAWSKGWIAFPKHTPNLDHEGNAGQHFIIFSWFSTPSLEIKHFLHSIGSVAIRLSKTANLRVTSLAASIGSCFSLCWHQ